MLYAARQNRLGQVRYAALSAALPSALQSAMDTADGAAKISVQCCDLAKVRKHGVAKHNKRESHGKTI